MNTGLQPKSEMLQCLDPERLSKSLPSGYSPESVTWNTFVESLAMAPVRADFGP